VNRKTTTENRESKTDQAQPHQKLMEDLHDIDVVAERRAEESVNFEEMNRRLKENGAS
jgi:hypothetical protein